MKKRKKATTPAVPREDDSRDIERAGVASEELVEIDGFRAIILPDRERGGFSGVFLDLAGAIDFHGLDWDSAKRDAAETLRVLLEYCQTHDEDPRRIEPLDWSDFEVPDNPKWGDVERNRRREHMRSHLLKGLCHRLKEIPPPHPGADLDPFAVGLFLVGARHTYFRQIVRDSNVKSVCDGYDGSATSEQAFEGHSEIEKPPEIQAAHRTAVKELRKTEATKAKKVASLPDARAKRMIESREKDREVIKEACLILDSIRKPITMNDLARRVANELERVRTVSHNEDGKPWTRRGVAPRLERVRWELPQNKILPSQNRSSD